MPVFDLLFLLRLYRGTQVESPSGVILCSLLNESPLSQVYETSINEEHPLGRWLLDDCEGPWRMRMHRPLQWRQTSLAFARVADAITFRILSS